MDDLSAQNKLDKALDVISSPALVKDVKQIAYPNITPSGISTPAQNETSQFSLGS